MKFATLAVLGGLAFAGTALAGEPAPQNTGVSGSSLKIAIDPKTGKRRAMTAEESAALDAKAPAPAAAARSRTAMAATTSAQRARPATMDEALKNMRTVDGIQGFKMPEDMMSTLTVTRNADGSFTMHENGHPAQHAAQPEAGDE